MPTSWITLSMAISFVAVGALSLVIARAIQQSNAGVKSLSTEWFFRYTGWTLVLLGLHSLVYLQLPSGAISSILTGICHALWFILAARAIIKFIDIKFWENTHSLENYKQPPRVLYHIACIIIIITVLLLIIQKVLEITIPIEFVVSSGILAAAAGFAAKDILSDMVAGLVISIDRPYRRGHWIELDDQKTLGKVIDISWRTTKILTWFNTTKEVPNSQILRQTVDNFSSPSSSYAHWFYIHMPAEVSISLTRRVLLQACLDCDEVLEDPSPVVRLWEMEHRPFKYMIYVHFKSYESFFKSKSKVLTHINHALAQEGIAVAAEALDVDYYTFDHKRAPVLEYSNEQLIKKVKVFKLLDDAQCETLLEDMNVLQFDDGDTILEEGDSNDSLYILASGKIKVVSSFEDSSEHIIERMSPGNYFGVMALLASEPSQDRYVASGECQVLQLEQTALEPLLNNNPELMNEMASFLAKQKFQRLAILESLTQTDQQSGNNSLKSYGKEILSSIQSAFSAKK